MDTEQKIIEIKFCPYCGTKLDPGARFCKNCGKSITALPSPQPHQDDGKGEKQPAYAHPQNEPIKQMETVYEGTIHKCPRCGEVLNAFVSNCPSCGHEIRGAHSAHSVREFALKLEKIESQKMPPFEGKKSIMKTVFGKDFDDKDDAEEVRKEFDERKQQEKANLIINYSVPNTKEDILEFMILAATNINVKNGVDDDVTGAWIAKLEQVYQRAQLSMGSSKDFAVIKDIYDKKKSQLKNRKFKGLSVALLIIGGYALLTGVTLIADEMIGAGAITIIIGIALLITGFKFLLIYRTNN